MKKHLLMFITIILCMSAYAQETKKELPLPAREVVERMDKEILAAKQKAIQGLTKVLSDVVKTGNLEVANKVKTKLEEITSETAGLADSQKKKPWYLGRWKMVEPVGSIWSCSVNEDGTATCTDAKKTTNGTWKLENNSIVFLWTISGYSHKLFIGNKVNNLYTMKGNAGGEYRMQFLDEKKN